MRRDKQNTYGIVVVEQRCGEKWCHDPYPHVYMCSCIRKHQPSRLEKKILNPFSLWETDGSVLLPVENDNITISGKNGLTTKIGDFPISCEHAGAKKAPRKMQDTC